MWMEPGVNVLRRGVAVLLVLVLLVFVVLRKLHCAPCAKSAQHHGRGPPADLVS
jgi:hypothetical protein